MRKAWCSSLEIISGLPTCAHAWAQEAAISRRIGIWIKNEAKPTGLQAATVRCRFAHLQTCRPHESENSALESERTVQRVFDRTGNNNNNNNNNNYYYYYYYYYSSFDCRNQSVASTGTLRLDTSTETTSGDERRNEGTKLS